MNELSLLLEIKNKNLTLKQFCEYIGMSEQSLYLRARGRRQFKQNEIRKIKELLELTPEQVTEIFFSENESSLDKKIKHLIKDAEAREGNPAEIDRAQV